MSRSAAEQETLESLARLLDRAVRALGDAGEADAACRLAAEAWWLLREPSPKAARRLNTTLHRLTVHRPRNAKGDACPQLTPSSTSAASRRPAGTS